MNTHRFPVLLYGFLLWLLLLPSAQAAEEKPSESPKVQIDIQIEDAENVLLGKTLTAVITLTYPNEVEVHFPKKPSLGKHIHMSGHDVSKKTNDKKSSVETHTITFHVLRTGRQQFASIDIPYIHGENTDTANSPAQTLYIKSRLANEVAPTLKPPSAPLVIHEKNDPLIWSLIGLGIILATIFLTLLVSRALRSRFGYQAADAPQRPAHEIAIERLNSLQETPLLTQDDFQEYCFELTEITREYFTNRYTIHALGDTTTELIEQLNEMKPEDLDLQVVSDIFLEADLIKFAKMPADTTRLTEALQQVRQMIQATFIQPLEEEEEALPEIGPAEPYARTTAWCFDLAVAHLALLLPAFLIATFSGRTLSPWTGPALLSAFILFRDLLPGGSPGKKQLKLRVVSSDDARSGPHPFFQLVFRNILLVIPVIGIVAAYVWMQQDVDGCRPGDRLAGTMVIDTKKGTGSRRPTLILLASALVITGILIVVPMAFGITPFNAWIGG